MAQSESTHSQKPNNKHDQMQSLHCTWMGDRCLIGFSSDFSGVKFCADCRFFEIKLGNKCMRTGQTDNIYIYVIHIC